jgi:hypothetical protein
MVIQHQSRSYGRLVLTPPLALSMVGHLYRICHGGCLKFLSSRGVALKCAGRVEERWLLVHARGFRSNGMLELAEETMGIEQNNENPQERNRMYTSQDQQLYTI